MNRWMLLSLLMLSVAAWSGEQVRLSDYGIPDNLPDNVVSSMEQGLAYTMILNVDASEGDEHIHDVVYVVFEPNSEYGIDLYLKYDKTRTEISSEKRYRQLLNEAMKLQHRLITLGNRYDPNSVKLIEQTEQHTKLGYRYESYGLPQDIAFMRHLDAVATIEQGQLKRIELNNRQAFDHSFRRINEYRQSVEFFKNESNQYIMSRRSLSFSGTRFSKPFKVSLEGEFISYRLASGEEVILRPELSVDLNDQRFETVRVKLDRTFPIWGKEVRKRGYDLPMPFGVMLTYRRQSNFLDFTSFTINGSRAFEAIFDPEGSNGNIDTDAFTLRADMFVLPFLNVYGVVGKIKAKADLVIDTTKLGEILIPQGKLVIPLELNNTMAGLGAVSAVGYKNYFASLNVTYAISVTEEAGTNTTTWVMQPMVGYQFPDYRARILLGAEYQDLSSSISGSLSSDFNYDIGIKSEKWAGVVGVHKEIGSQFETVLMYSKGQHRDAITWGFGYRF
ncbi:hypothetical protein [Agarivorans sp. Alg241-V36]|uniref:hypothetical protein n=1 Tax=Agarivorans sp. Alg241-V36 TaxID=2305992 RepID=UPI0013D30651|nr:hypothetical protein [Agarivorans sp. Alg241-V36]